MYSWTPTPIAHEQPDSTDKDDNVPDDGLVPLSSILKGVCSRISLDHRDGSPAAKLCDIEFAKACSPEFRRERPAKRMRVALDASLPFQPGSIVFNSWGVNPNKSPGGCACAR